MPFVFIACLPQGQLLPADITSICKLLPVLPPPPLQTGFLPSLEDWDRLLAACRAHGCYLFSDEMYRGLGGLASFGTGF